MSTIALITSDPIFRKELRQMIGIYDPEYRIVEEASSIAEARQWPDLYAFDTLFLDINLPDGNAFDLLDSLSNKRFNIVFLSENTDSAWKAFQYNAFDFLLKPSIKEELPRVLEKLRRHEPMDKIARQLPLLFRGVQAKQLEKIILHLAEGIHILPLNETVRLESDGCYTSFFTSNGDRVIVTKAIGDFEYLTNNGAFFRVHQSHIVNLSYVRKVLKEDGGYVVLDSGAKIPVARRRKEDFYQSVVRHSSI